MFKRLRRLFFAVSALGYGLLGGGPSLWALGVQAPLPSCQFAGCTCSHHGQGEACCCRAKAKLLKKFPELAKDPFYMKLVQPAKAAPLAPGQSAWQSSCGQADGDGAPALPPLQPHILVEVGQPFHLGAQRVQVTPAPRGSSYVPEPPTPIPD